MWLFNSLDNPAAIPALVKHCLVLVPVLGMCLGLAKSVSQEKHLYVHGYMLQHPLKEQKTGHYLKVKSIGNWCKNVQYIYTVEYNLAVKRRRNLLSANRKQTLLSEKCKVPIRVENKTDRKNRFTCLCMHRIFLEGYTKSSIFFFHGRTRYIGVQKWNRDFSGNKLLPLEF